MPWKSEQNHWGEQLPEIVYWWNDVKAGVNFRTHRWHARLSTMEQSHIGYLLERGIRWIWKIAPILTATILSSLSIYLLLYQSSFAWKTKLLYEAFILFPLVALASAAFTNMLGDKYENIIFEQHVNATPNHRDYALEDLTHQAIPRFAIANHVYFLMEFIFYLIVLFQPSDIAARTFFPSIDEVLFLLIFRWFIILVSLRLGIAVALETCLLDAGRPLAKVILINAWTLFKAYFRAFLFGVVFSFISSLVVFLGVPNPGSYVFPIVFLYTIHRYWSTVMRDLNNCRSRWYRHRIELDPIDYQPVKDSQELSS